MLDPPPGGVSLPQVVEREELSKCRGSRLEELVHTTEGVSAVAPSPNSPVLRGAGRAFNLRTKRIQHTAGYLRYYQGRATNALKKRLTCETR